MRVIPACAVLRDAEFVGEAVTRSDWTLRDTVNTVILESFVLTSAVEMDGCSVVSQVILDGDLDPIAPASFDVGTWVHFVEGLASSGSGDAIGIDGVVGDIEMILYVSA